MTNDRGPSARLRSLVEELDKRSVMLRDGSKILGTLRSFDQFANIVLQDAVERIIVGSSYSDIPLGLYIVRGENVVLMGEVDETKETEGLTMVDNDEIKRAREAARGATSSHPPLSRMAFQRRLARVDRGDDRERALSTPRGDLGGRGSRAVHDARTWRSEPGDDAFSAMAARR